jgi:CHAT domain-containing protein
MPSRLRLLTLLCHVALLSSPVVAQVQPGGLGTRVNGSALGRCNSGVCAIAGGTAAGGNLFLRLGRYDTRSGIQRVDLDTRRRQTVVVGVGDPAGSFFDTPLRLSSPASLIWLSPGGIWLGPGSRIINAPSQLFSTSPSIRLGSGVFVASGGLDAAVGQLGQAIQLETHEDGAGDISQRLGLQGSAPIVLAGGRLTVDRHLLLDSGRGPIVTAPRTSSTLKSGGGIHISGGQLNLQQLQLEGVGAVSLQALADDGQARLREAQITGRQVLIQGKGGIWADGVSIRANGAGTAGRIQLETASDPTATVKLQNVTLQGEQIVMRSSGDLTAEKLLARATATGRVQLESSGGHVTLKDTQLQGQQVVVRAAQQLSTEGLQAQASDESLGRIWLEGDQAVLRQTSLRGRDVVVDTRGNLMVAGLAATAGASGREGNIWLQAGQGDNGKPAAEAQLQQLTLRGENVVVLAAKALKGEGWSIDTGSHASAGVIAIATGQDEQRQTGGTISLQRADLTAKTIVIRTAAGYDLSQLVATASQTGTNETIQLEIGRGLTTKENGGSADRSNIGDHGVMRDAQLRGRGIGIRAGDGLTLERVEAEAGLAGDRGVVILETDADAQRPLQLMASQLAGRQLILKGGAIEVLDGSSLKAPKGWIHLDAQGSPQALNAGHVTISGSRLDVGLQQGWADLGTDTNWTQKIEDQTITKQYPPSIGIYATRDIRVDQQSQLLTTQNLDAMELEDSSRFTKGRRLTNNSGLIVLDAKGTVVVSNSQLEANASHNLAGTIVIRSQSQSGATGVQLRDQTSVKASGGAGAGDVLLRSSNGIAIHNSRLEAVSDRASNDRYFFGGGELSLVNDSTTKGVEIRQSTLLATQTQNKALTPYSPYIKDGWAGDGKFMTDDYDNDDQPEFMNSDSRNSGGSINITSAGGMSITEQSALRTSDLFPQSYGGVIRLVNTSGQPLEISRQSQLVAETGPHDGVTPPLRPKPESFTMKSEIILWSQGDINISNASMNALNTLEPQEADATRHDPMIVMATANNIGVTGSRIAIAPPSSTDQLPTNNLRLVTTRANAIQGPDTLVVTGATTTPLADVPPVIVGFLPSFDHLPDVITVADGVFHEIPGELNLALVRDERVDDPLPTSSRRDAIPTKVKLTGSGTPSAPVAIFSPDQPVRTVQPSLPGRLQTNRILLSPPPAARSLAIDTPLAGAHPLPARPLVSATSNLARNDALARSSAVVESDSTTVSTQTLSAEESQTAFLLGEDKASRMVQAALHLGDQQPQSMTLNSLQNTLRLASHGRYKPAVLRIQISPPDETGLVTIDQILMTADAGIQGWKTRVSQRDLTHRIKTFQQYAAQQLAESAGESGMRLSQILLGPAQSALEQLGVNSILLSLDRGLQGVPFSALPLQEATFGARYAYTITPSLFLTQLTPQPHRKANGLRLLAGTSQFSEGLPALPKARQELQAIADLAPDSRLLLDDEFNQDALLRQIRESPISLIHLATHAEFPSADAASPQVHTASGLIRLDALRHQIRSSQGTRGIDLFVVNACRTAIGNERDELGIAGLALQSGATTALGTLWYVDDAAAAAFLIQFHRFISMGLQKDQALQKTQQLFRDGLIHVVDDQIVSGANQPLLTGLTRSEQARLRAGLQHPYFWAGMVLSGLPW